MFRQMFDTIMYYVVLFIGVAFIMAVIAVGIITYKQQKREEEEYIQRILKENLRRAADNAGYLHCVSFTDYTKYQGKTNVGDAECI